jgi:four helix bundle protein
MVEGENEKPYDLELRTELFARNVRELVRRLPRSMTNRNDALQLVRCSGSIAANYIEANGSLSKKDFMMRLRICRKEAKETRLWLRLIYTDDSSEQNADRDKLLQESVELISIITAILNKAE